VDQARERYEGSDDEGPFDSASQQSSTDETATTRKP